ncbi:hypothetical protein AAG906_004490 [Vitis piasezkii]
MSLWLWMIFRDTSLTFGNECYILRDGENLGKFDAKSNEDIDHNKIYEVVPLDDTLEEIRKKHRSRLLKNHPISNVIGNVNECVVTRRQTRLSEMGLVCYTSQLEPKNVLEALGDESWTIALQEELNQFTRNDMWYLVPKSNDKHVIGTKWIFKNKHDEMRSL